MTFIYIVDFIYYCVLKTIFVKFYSFYDLWWILQCFIKVLWMNISSASLINKNLFSFPPREAAHKVVWSLYILRNLRTIQCMKLVFHKKQSGLFFVTVIAQNYVMELWHSNNSNLYLFYCIQLVSKMWATIIFTYA